MVNNCFTHLILEHTRAESPDAGEYKVQLIQLLRTISRCVLFRQQALQQMTQHLNVRDFHDGGDLLEAGAENVQTGRYVLVKQDGQISTLGLLFTSVDPR